ncbi:TPA: hypothetical protein NGR52_004186 [Vibrio parahaemolyticus]|nr:hypothetical protein [Vibrio parahaemolyticus]
MNETQRHLIQSIAKAGHDMTVADYEGTLQTRTNNVQAVVNAIDSVEECYVHVLDGTTKLGTLFYVDQELNDYSDNENIKPLVTV